MVPVPRAQCTDETNSVSIPCQPVNAKGNMSEIQLYKSARGRQCCIFLFCSHWIIVDFLLNSIDIVKLDQRLGKADTLIRREYR